MPVVTIKRSGEKNINLEDGSKQKLAFVYDKVVVGKYKDNDGNEKDAGYPTFAELASFYKGAVEVKTDKDGEVDGNPLILDAIDGLNSRSYQIGMNSALNTPERVFGKMRAQLKEMAKTSGIPFETLWKQFTQVANPATTSPAPATS